ncbi:starvation-inducible DNA-binding protein [Eubacterium aggregans]|uniref:Starvation-inducible DNA-binding protein n=1 Tax=Eubacterium aggregans TaxID=81409 RepID=A0A1H3Z4D4_9FIRM|nr:DNA starvation/stationary phase protection protein [Eubacterium aggregans]SEA18557.1 starvation-inducible DNA-binding protein [Eubacterium aggregans]
MKQELSNQLNQYLADSAVLYIKLHNLHWNVVGPDFKPVHEYLEGLYDTMPEILDEVAEALKMHGETPLASLKDYLAVTDLEELPSKELRSLEILPIVKGDMISMKAEADAIRSEADAEGLYDLVAMMEGHLGGYSKTIWFLESMMK